jgi:hypothetical protein
LKTLKFDIDLLNAFDKDLDKLVQSAKRNGFTNFHYTGTLEFDQTKITSFPSNFTVTGNLHLYLCKHLKSVGGNLNIGRNLDLEGCENLISIGNNIFVGKDLDLTNCKKLKSLPNNLSVGSLLYLRGTPITTLPEVIEIKSRIIR